VVSNAKTRSGRRVVLVGAPLVLLGAALVIGTFSKYGQGNFTRAARIVEARGRAYELAAGIARCMNHEGRAELPESAPPVPEKPPRALEVDAKKAAQLFSRDVFKCAAFHPRGEVHIQIEWRREEPNHGVVIARLDDDGDGNADFEATSRVACEPPNPSGPAPERCRAALVEERRLTGK
jgi:hypothetical protein